MNKNIFLDVETTGTDQKANGIIQIAGIVEINDIEIERFDYRIQPFPFDKIEAGALDINHVAPEMLDTYKEPKIIHKELSALLAKHIDKFNKLDKYNFIGYNAKFDYDFMRQWFVKNGDSYFGSYFWWPAIDVAVLAAHKMMKKRHEFSNFKLMTVASGCGIDADQTKAHDAFYDIEITRQIYKSL